MENLTLPEFYDLLESFDWFYMMKEPRPKVDGEFDENCPHMSRKKKHIEIKEFIEGKEEYAQLYRAFEKHHYRFQPKPERPNG